jgi:phthalate 4,5-cis-dihydrodiol dehydrogenase
MKTPVTIRLGIAGFGLAGRSVLHALSQRGDVVLTAIADAVPEARASAGDRGVAICASVEELAARADVDAVYVATPTDLHAEHVEAVAAAGKHVLVEKPMAVDLDQAERMIAACERAGVVLLVGHSHSYDAPYAAIREIIASGRLGRVRMMQNICYTDWMYRPRRPEELQTAHGGGVTFRQGAHQFDMLRLFGGGLVERVRAVTFDWDPARAGIGAHTVLLFFRDGAAATAIYNGYGAFLSAELTYDRGEAGHPLMPAAAGAARRAFRARDAGDERTAKRAGAAGATTEDDAPYQPTFGWTLVSCEGGDIRQAPDGLYVYTEHGRDEIVLPLAPRSRERVLAEFVDAIAGRRAPIHDGRWGRANLEVCVAAIASAERGADVSLQYQVPVPSAAEEQKIFG